MSKFYKIIAVLIMAISAFVGAVSIATITVEGAFIILIASLLGFMFGFALYTIGDLIDRVKSLEEKIEKK